MRTFLNKHKFGMICSVFVCLILCFTIIALSVVPVMADSRVKKAETASDLGVSDDTWKKIEEVSSDKAEASTTITDVATSAAGWMGYRLKMARKEQKADYVDPFNDNNKKWVNGPGMAGAYVGFTKNAESTDGDDTGSFLGVRFTKANVSYSLDSFISGRDGYSLKSEYLAGYVYYGAVLRQLGLDKYGSANGSFITVVGGGIAFGLYAAASVVPKMMNFFIKALQFVNPFGMLSTSKELGGSGNLSVAETSDNANESAFESFREWYGNIIDTLAGITWAVLIPLFIVSIIVTFLLFKKTDLAKTRYRKLSTRIIFLAIGIPLLGALYTGVLNEMEDLTKQPLSAADEAVASTYVDFESWAFLSNLQPPSMEDGAFPFQRSVLKDSTGLPASKSVSYWNLKYYALTINNDYAKDINVPVSLSALEDFGAAGPSTDGNPVSEWTSSNIQEQSSDEGGVLNSGITNLLMRYISGNVVTAGDYGSLLMGDYASNSAALVMIHNLDTLKEFKDFKDEDGNKVAQFLKNPSHANGLITMFNNGNMKMKNYSEWKGYSDASYSHYAFEPGDAHEYQTHFLGLCDVAMYNYLNSEFHDTSVTVFGANETVSLFSQNYHRSVNVVGSGFTSLAFWFNCICTLLAYAVVGWFYAFGMLFQNIKRTFMVLTKIPMAALGIMRSMAQVVAYGIIMLVEVFFTIFMYVVVMSMLQSIPNLVMRTMVGLMKDADTTSSGGLVAYLLIASFIMIFLMIKSLSLRKTILKGIDEGINSIIARIFGTDSQLTPEANANINGGQHALRNGMIAGAGMAMANRMLSPNKDSAGADGKDGEGADGEDGSSGANGANGGSGRNAAASTDGKDGSGQGFDTSDFGEGADAKEEENKGRMAALRDSLGDGSDGGRMSDRIKRKAVGAQDAADAKHAAKQNAKFGYAMDENGNIDRSKLSRGDRAKFDAGNALHKARGEGRALSAQARGAVTDKAGDAKSAAKRGAIATRDAAVGAGKSVVGAAQAGGQHLKVGSAISSANRASKSAYKHAINSGASQADAQKAASAARAKTLKAAGVTETMIREHDVKMKDVMKQGAAQARGNASAPKSMRGKSSTRNVTDEVRANHKFDVKPGTSQINAQPQGNSKIKNLSGSSQRATKTDTIKVDTRTKVQKGQNQLNGAAAFMSGVAMASMMDGANNKGATRHAQVKNTIIYDAENVGRKGTTRASGYRPGSQGPSTSRRQGSTSRIVTDNRQQFDTSNQGFKGNVRDEGYSSEDAASEMSTRRRNKKGKPRHGRK